MNKILIIEDDPVIGNTYRNRMTREGFEVEVANDGQSGFYRIHEFHPDAVLLDLMLPKLNGVDILKKIRAQAKFKAMPVIVFTNAYVSNMIHEAFSAGATQVFNKATATPRQLIDALRNSLDGVTGAPSATPVPAADTNPSEPASSADGGVDLETASASPSSSQSAQGEDAPAVTESALSLPTARADTEPPSTVEIELQAEAFQGFVATGPETLAAVRKSLHQFTKAQSEAERLPYLLELYRKVHALTGSAGFAGLHQLSRMSAALEALLKELYDKPKNINASTLRTVANSIDFVAELFQKGLDPYWRPTSPINIMVVDDEILSRRAMLYALETVGLKAESVEDPQQALTLAQENIFDLIFLDIQMPGMDGFDLCKKIHEQEANRTTPVIFVTSLTDFTSRARSTLSGGVDLIAKPFLFIELSLKALTYVLRGQLAGLHEERRAA